MKASGQGAQKQSLVLVDLGPGMSVPKGEIRRPLPHHLSKTCGTQKRDQSYLNVEITQSELTKYAARNPRNTRVQLRHNLPEAALEHDPGKVQTSRCRHATGPFQWEARWNKNWTVFLALPSGESALV